MNGLKSSIKSVTAFAPASCANVAVGFDILGFSIANIGDSVTLTKRDDDHIVIKSISSADVLPYEIEKNTASVAIQKVVSSFGIQSGFTIEIQKGIPLSSGMGGSAASAAAALVALNAFFEKPLSLNQLIDYGMFGESVASGEMHADNIAPSIMGGLLLIQSINPLSIVRLPIPDVYYVIVHPHLYIATQEARKLLSKTVSLHDHIKQSANLAGFIAALYQNDMSLLQNTLSDSVIESQRAMLIPGFYDVKDAAIKAGALGMSLSGSGPSLFALARNKQDAHVICSVMCNALNNNGIKSDYWVDKMSDVAAHVTEIM